MIELTPHDAAVLSRLVRFSRLPMDRRRQFIDELQSPEAREVGEGLLDPGKTLSSDKVRATVDRYRQWRESNLRIQQRRRRAVRS